MDNFLYFILISQCLERFPWYLYKNVFLDGCVDVSFPSANQLAQAILIQFG